MFADPRRCSQSETGWHEHVGVNTPCIHCGAVPVRFELPRPLPCERKPAKNEKACGSPNTRYVQGQWVCPTHEATGDEHCSHSLAPSSRCSHCGASVESNNQERVMTDGR